MSEQITTPQTVVAVEPTLVGYDIGKNRSRLVQFMQQTHDTIIHLLTPVSQETATTLRDAHDGEKGWTLLEVLGHLHDFDNIFRMRAKIIRYQEYPTLPPQDHHLFAAMGNYNGKDLRKTMEEFSHSRRKTIAFFDDLSDDLWQRAGIHPERGHFTLLDAALQVGLHDLNHIEQMTRILYHNV